MIAVLDTSAFVRLFIPDGPVPEGLDAFLNGVQSGRNVLLAPELLMAEAANVLNAKRERGELSTEESDELLRDMLSMPIRHERHAGILPSACRFARDLGLTVYDAVFLALAHAKGALLYTSDEELKKAAVSLGIPVG